MRKGISKLIIISMMVLLSFTTVSASTESIVDISGMSIHQIQEQVDKGFITYEQLTGIYLDRIEAYNEQYAAIITVNKEALAQAKALDEEFKETGRRSMLHGIPVLVKDNIDVKGMPTTAGAKGLLKNLPNENAEIIENVIEAGGIVIAKANMDEFAFNAAMSKSMFGLVKNGYDLNTSSYGSSGGTGAGIAADLAVVGIGTDTGTSIRVPSSANNLYGLRPTKTTISSDGVIQFESTRDVSGPMAKYPEDAAILYGIMSGQKEILIDKADTSALEGLKVGILRSQYNKSPDYIQRLMDSKIQDLKDAGVKVSYVSSFSLSYDFDASNFCYEFGQYIKNTTGPIQSLKDLINSGEYSQYIDGYAGYNCESDYRNTQSFKTYQSKRDANIASANRQFANEGIDILIYPTITERLKSLSSSLYNSVDSYAYAISPQTGFPAMNVPMGFASGLPYGMEMVAKSDKDTLLLQVASYLDSVDSTYVLPEISPALYTPIEKIPQLQEIIAKEHKETEYKEVQEEMQAFLDNYSDYEDKEKTANELIAAYEAVPEILIQKEIARKAKIMKYIKIAAIILTVVLLLLLLLILRVRKVNRIRNKRRRMQERR